MTEAQWLAETDPDRMLAFLQDKASDRKLRLFGCACCRRRWNWLPFDECKRAVEEAERYADGLVTREQLNQTRKEARWAIHRADDSQFYAATAAARLLRARAATASRQAADFMRKQRGLFTPVPKAFRGRVVAFSEQEAAEAAWEKACRASEIKEGIEQAALLRDIIGNPLHHVVAHPSWRTPKVIKLSQAIYAKGAVDQLDELAAALEQAGCVNDDLGSHCREPRLHVRGCWVVDLLLGKE